MAYGPGDNPHAPPARKKPTRRRVSRSKPRPRRTPAAPSPAVRERHAERAQRIARPPKARPARHAPPPARAPSPAVKEQHRAVALERPKTRKAKAKLHAMRQPVAQAKRHPHTPASLLVMRDYHRTIGQTRPHRLGGRPEVAAHLRANEERDRTTRDRASHPRERRDTDIYLTDPKALKAAGFKSDALDTAAELPLRAAVDLGASAYQTTRAAIEDPKHVVPKTLKGLGESVAAIPAGLAYMATHPGKAPQALIDDVRRRYGNVVKDPEAFRARLKKEGAAPEVIDLLSVVSAGGATAGRSLGTLARAGKLGERAERIATVRPRVRVSGATSVEQKVHHNFFRAAASAGRDVARKKVQARRAAGETASLEVRQAERAGEVTHIRKRAQAREQHRAVAKAKGRRFAQMKAEGQRETKAAAKNLHRLNRAEKRAFKYAVQFGIHTPEAAREHLPQWIKRVEKARAEHVKETGKEIPDTQNELADLHWLLEHADEAFTPRLAEVASQEGERAARVGGADPGVDAGAAERRRHAAQAELLGEARPLTKDELRAGTREAKEGVKRAKAGESRTARAEGKAQGRAEILSRNVGGVRAEKDAMRRPIAEPKTKAAPGARAAMNGARTKAAPGVEVKAAGAVSKSAPGAKARREPQGPFYEGGGHGINLAAQHRNGLEARIEEAQAHLERARQIEREGGYEIGGHRVPASEFADHLERIIERAKGEGLERPGYFPSEKRPAGMFSAFAVGGRKAVAGSKRYEGRLLRTGRENNAPEAHILSIQKGIKRKHNWNLVADQFDAHAVEWSKNQTLDELQDELERRHIDPDTVAFWNPARYRSVRQEIDKNAGGGDVEIADPTFEARNIDDALRDSAFDAEGVHALDPEYKGTSGWSIVPREVYEEIHADVRPSSPFWRKYDIAKGKLSRVMLANPAWLQFQIASNAMMTGLAGVGPVDALKAQRWWKSLSTEERDAIEPYIGVHSWYDDQRHLGAASNGRLVNAYRAFKTTPFYQRAHQGNPFNLLFRADNAQNNFFRKAVLYNRVKREAYARMGQEANTAMRAQRQIVDMLTLKQPDEAMRALIKDGRVIENHAKAVTDFLGDWTTYTANERRKFARATMFYGFLRFSVKLAFYTMPIEHPIMSGLLLELGHLQAEELKDLFGGDVPVWELGNYYSDHGTKFALARLNPFFNALQFKGPGSLVGSFGPLAQVTINQLAGKNVSFDRFYTTHGSTQYVLRAKDLSFEDRLRIGAAELLRVSPYYRLSERLLLHGRQTSDSLVFSPRSTGAPGLGEKSHDLGPALKEFAAPLAGEDGQPSIQASRQTNGADVDHSGGPFGKGKARFGGKANFGGKGARFTGKAGF